MRREVRRRIHAGSEETDEQSLSFVLELSFSFFFAEAAELFRPKL